MLDPIWGAILSDDDIRSQLESTYSPLIVKPLCEPVQPVSIDMRLGDSIVIPKGGRVVDPALGKGTDDQAEHFTAYALEPNGFVCASLLEWVEMPGHLVGFLVGKSTLARLGLQVEAAGLVDPGWKGNLTLEIKNLSWDTIILRPGMKICQMYILPVFRQRPSKLYGDPELNSRYLNSRGAVPAKLNSYDPELLVPDPVVRDPQP